MLASAAGIAGVVAVAEVGQAIANFGFVVAVAAAGQVIANFGFEDRSLMTMIVEVTGSGILEIRGGPSIAGLVPTSDTWSGH